MPIARQRSEFRPERSWCGEPPVHLSVPTLQHSFSFTSLPLCRALHHPTPLLPQKKKPYSLCVDSRLNPWTVRWRSPVRPGEISRCRENPMEGPPLEISSSMLRRAPLQAVLRFQLFSFGAIAATFVCPLDVIKTRFQVHGLPEMPPSAQRSVIISSLEQIIKNEGIKGLYRGLSPTIAALLPTWAVYFTVYNQLKYLLQSHVDGNNQLSIGANILAASGAGAATAIGTNPLWVVKTRLQTQALRPGVVPYRSMLSALRRIVHEEGFQGLYSGLLPSLAGVSHVAIQFPSYEKIKYYLARKDNTTVDELGPGSVVIASALSKVVASTMTYPHEVIRSRLQEQGQARDAANRYTGVVDCIKKVFQKEGIPGFYHGCGTNLLRTTPTAVITFTSYEMIKRFLHQMFPT